MKNLRISTLVLLLLTSSVARAATFQVTKTTDEVGPCDPGDCALREAVLAANALPGADIIEVPAGTYLLTIPGAEEYSSLAGDLNLIGDLEIRGSRTGRTIIQSTVADRVLAARAPPDTPSTVRLADLVISGGDSDAGGGMLASRLFLTIERSTISGNNADVVGGGILLQVSDLNFIDSTIANNTVPDGLGGGIELNCLINSPCSVLIQGSTISGNSADSGASGILNEGATLTIRDSTIANNAGPFGSAIYTSADSPVTQISRSLISGGCISLNAVGNASAGGNIEGPGDTCQLNDPTDQVSVANLGLGPLADNGGPTFTHALLPGSPAIDAAGSDCAAFDQRGFARPQDGDFDGLPFCDAGAFEAFARGVDVEVPSLGPAGLAALAALLALAGLAWIRRAA